MAENPAKIKVAGNLKGVKGWLLFLCLILVVGNPLIVLFGLGQMFQVMQAPSVAQLPNFVNLLIAFNVLNVMIRAYGVYAGIKLWKLKPGAVAATKKFLIALAVYAVLLVFVPFMTALPGEVQRSLIPGVLNDAMRLIVFAVLWYTYLNKSKRVKATY